MPAYNPGDFIWQEIYLMFDQIGQAIQAAMLYLQGITPALVVVGLVSLAILILLWAWYHRSVEINQSTLRMIPRALLIMLAVTLLWGA